jgi:hypothetical protein
MPKPIQRHDIVDFETYAERRAAERERLLALKAPRRVHVGDSLTFLFENTETMRYQVQEMMLAERIVKEAAIQHEIDTYNAILGGPGELGCSLLIEIDDPELRATKLREWLELPRHVYVRLEDGSLVYARFDPGQVGEDRLSAVQYLKFDTHGHTPVAVGCDLPALTVEILLTEAQRQALREDLGD